MEQHIILLNILGSMAAVLLSISTILFAWKNSVKKLFSLRTAGNVCSVYLLAGVVVLLFCLCVTGKVPEPGRQDAGLLLTVMTIGLTAVWLSVFAVTFYGCWRKKQIFSADIAILLALMLQVLCIFFVRLRASLVFSKTANLEKHLPVMILTFLATNGVVFLMANQAKNEAAEKEMAEAKHQAELERIHFEKVEERRKELGEIRSNYDALLAQACVLIERNQAGEARKLLNGLSERIESTKETPFCRIPAVNAILEMKKKECDREHIALNVELVLPEDLPIKDLDLCIALGNLLDNAIRECKKASGKAAVEPGGEKILEGLEESKRLDEPVRPEIFLVGKVVQGYLVLRCVNPVYFEEQHGPEGTGYGLKILKDMAERYHGDFFTKRECGSFISQLSLFIWGDERDA